MSPCVLAFLVLLLSAEKSWVLSLVALHNAVPESLTELEDYVPVPYRLPHLQMCDIVVLSELSVHWTSSLRPVKLASNFSYAGLVTKCTFLYVFCNGDDPYEVAKKTRNFILLQRKLIQKIVIVILFLHENNERHVNLQSLADVIKKRVVFVSNGRQIKYKNKDKVCGLRNLKCILHGREVRIVFSQNKPYLFLKHLTVIDVPQNQQLVLSPANVQTIGPNLVGTEAELLKLLCQKYNMTLKLSMYEHGTVFPNGTWVGKLRELRNGRADIGVSRLPGSFGRNQIAHHSSYIFYFCYNIISLKPGRVRSLFAILRPFTQTVWYGIGISVVLVGVSLWLVVRFHAWRLGSHCELTTLRAILFAAVTLLKVPWSRAQNRAPQALAGMWLLMAAILQASYSSRLMLSYSIVEYEDSPKTVDDLISMGRTALVLNGGTSSAILRGYNQLHVEAFPHEVPPAELSDPTKVIISDPTRYKFMIMDSGEHLSYYYFGRKPILQIFSGWLYSFQFDWSDSIDLFILRAGQLGLITKWTREQQSYLRQLEEEKGRGENHAEFKNASITLWNLQAVFLMLIIGNVLATVVFILEIIIFSLQKLRTSQNIRSLISLQILSLFYKIQQREK